MIGWLAPSGQWPLSCVQSGGPPSLTMMADMLFACSNAIGLFLFSLSLKIIQKSETIFVFFFSFQLLLCLWVFSYSDAYFFFVVRASVVATGKGQSSSFEQWRNIILGPPPSQSESSKQTKRKENEN
jgi:hypothetical protein